MGKVESIFTWEGHHITIKNALSWKYLWMFRETAVSVDGVEIGRTGGVKSWKLSDLQFPHEGQQCKLDLHVWLGSRSFSIFPFFTLSINDQPFSEGRLEPASRARYACGTLAMLLIGGLIGALIVTTVHMPDLVLQTYYSIKGNLVYGRGKSAFADGQYEQALDLYWQTVELSRKASNRRNEAIALVSIGAAYLANDQPNKALSPGERSLQLAQEIDDLELESSSLSQIGQTYTALTLPERALDYYIQARHVFQELEDWEHEALALGLVAMAYTEMGQLDEAERALLDALAIAEDRNDQELEEIMRKTIACITTDKILLASAQSPSETYESDCPQFAR